MMRVICQRIESPTTGEELSTSSWLTVGKEYVVLSVLASPGKDVSLQILDDTGPGPSVWDADLFVTSSDRISSIWTVSIGEEGLSLAPASWQRPGFWEEYFDGRPDAVAAFEQGRDALLAEDEESPTTQGRAPRRT
jgi:hypothetical protein